MFRICIIRAEGISDTIDYQFALDNRPLPLSSKLPSSGPTCTVPSPGSFQISLKNPNRKSILLTVTFPTSLLQPEGFQWVPLFTCCPTPLQKFPDDVSGPKVLIMTTNDFLDSVDEASEFECEACESLKLEKIKLQQEFNKHVKESKIAIEGLIAENEKNKVLVKKFQGLYMECKKEVDIGKGRNEEERKRNSELSEKVKNLTYMLEDNTAKAKMREEFLESIINDREKEYKAAGDRIRLKSASIAEFERPASLSPNISLNTAILSQPNENSLNNTCVSLQSGLKSGSSQARLNTKRKVLSEINNSQGSANETYAALKGFLKQNNKQGLFTRDQGNIYKFGKKKIFITLKHGNLLCRVGGGFEAIEDFLTKNSEPKQTLSPFHSDQAHRRNRTNDDISRHNEIDLANSVYLRSSPEIEKLIKLRLRPSSNCITE